MDRRWCGLEIAMLLAARHTRSSTADDCTRFIASLEITAFRGAQVRLTRRRSIIDQPHSMHAGAFQLGELANG